MQTSGAERKKAAVAMNYYNVMVSAGEKSPYISDIEEV
jgi:hypothetical protein